MGDDRLLIFGGLYTEFVRVAKKNGTPGNPIVIEGVVGITPRPAVKIQGSITSMTGSGHNFTFHQGLLGHPMANGSLSAPMENTSLAIRCPLRLRLTGRWIRVHLRIR